MKMKICGYYSNSFFVLLISFFISIPIYGQNDKGIERREIGEGFYGFFTPAERRFPESVSKICLFGINRLTSLIVYVNYRDSQKKEELESFRRRFNNAPQSRFLASVGLLTGSDYIDVYLESDIASQLFRSGWDDEDEEFYFIVEIPINFCKIVKDGMPYIKEKKFFRMLKKGEFIGIKLEIGNEKTIIPFPIIQEDIVSELIKTYKDYTE